MKNDRIAFDREINRLLQDPRVRHMQDFRQHGGTNTLAHSLKVARASFELAQKLDWDIDEAELARGALLHDYYLYNIREKGLSPYQHGTTHPRLAEEMADRDFTLTEKEKNIIRSHMWPLTLFSLPRSREAALVCMADKYVAFKEMLLRKY